MGGLIIQEDYAHIESNSMLSLQATAEADDRGIDLCFDEALAFAGCRLLNTGSCPDDCKGIGGRVDIVSCTEVDPACKFFTCCQACENEGKELGNCQSALRGCDTNCGQVAPVPPSTPSPAGIDLCILTT